MESLAGAWPSLCLVAAARQAKRSSRAGRVAGNQDRGAAGSPRLAAWAAQAALSRSDSCGLSPFISAFAEAVSRPASSQGCITITRHLQLLVHVMWRIQTSKMGTSPTAAVYSLSSTFLQKLSLGLPAHRAGSLSCVLCICPSLFCGVIRQCTHGGQVRSCAVHQCFARGRLATCKLTGLHQCLLSATQGSSP